MSWTALTRRGSEFGRKAPTSSVRGRLPSHSPSAPARLWLQFVGFDLSLLSMQSAADPVPHHRRRPSVRPGSCPRQNSPRPFSPPNPALRALLSPASLSILADRLPPSSSSGVAVGQHRGVVTEGFNWRLERIEAQGAFRAGAPGPGCAAPSSATSAPPKAFYSRVPGGRLRLVSQWAAVVAWGGVSRTAIRRLATAREPELSAVEVPTA